MILPSFLVTELHLSSTTRASQYDILQCAKASKQNCWSCFKPLCSLVFKELLVELVNDTSCAPHFKVLTQFPSHRSKIASVSESSTPQQPPFSFIILSLPRQKQLTAMHTEAHIKLSTAARIAKME